MLDLRLRHQDPSKEQIVSPLLMDISGRHYCKYLIDSMASTPAAQPLIFWFQLPQENLHQGSSCLEGPLGTTVTTSSICPHNLRQGVPAWSCSFISGCLILSCLIFHNYLNKFLFFFSFLKHTKWFLFSWLWQTSLPRDFYSGELSGWPKPSIWVFRTILWKNPNKLFGDLNTMGSY